MIGLLEPLFRGAWAPYGETLACAAQPPADALRVADLLCDPALLANALRRHAAHLGASGDLRPVASVWSLHYLWALLPPVVAAASVLQHAFPVLPTQMSVTLNGAGEPTCFYIPDEGATCAGAGTASRFDGLLRGHLQPLFAALSRQARVAPKILWGNAARYLDSIFEQALRLAHDAPAIAQDREHLLNMPVWADGSNNPLHTRQREAMHIEEDGGASAITLHRQCCLYYLLPGEGYCHACPLAPQYAKGPKLRAAAPAA